MPLHEKGMQELAVSTAQKREDAAGFDRQRALDAMNHAQRPSTLYSPALRFQGDNTWVAALGGSNPAYGHGRSPEAALLDFDRIWKEGHGK